MFLCISRFAQAELIAPNNIGHAVQVSTVKGSSWNPESTYNKQSKNSQG